jgi:hypothetical protein
MARQRVTKKRAKVLKAAAERKAKLGVGSLPRGRPKGALNKIKSNSPNVQANVERRKKELQVKHRVKRAVENNIINYLNDIDMPMACDLMPRITDKGLHSSKSKARKIKMAVDTLHAAADERLDPGAKREAVLEMAREYETAEIQAGLERELASIATLPPARAHAQQAEKAHMFDNEDEDGVVDLTAWKPIDEEKESEPDEMDLALNHWMVKACVQALEETIEKCERKAGKNIPRVHGRDEVVRAFVRAINGKDMAEHLKGTDAAEIIGKGACEVFRDEIEKHWSVSRTLHLKLMTLMSRAHYTYVRNSLSGAINDEGHWERTKSASGVTFPRLVPWAHIMHFMKELEITMGMKPSEEGDSVTLDLDTNIRFEIAQRLKDGLLTLNANNQLVDKQGKRVLLQYKGDAANMHKGMKQTVFGVTFPYCSRTPHAQAPGEYKMLLCYADGDHTENLLKHGAEHLATVNRAVIHTKWEFPELGDGVWAQIDWCIGGDLSCLNSLLGNAGCNASYPCPLCECPKEHMAHTDKLGQYVTTKRSLEKIRLMTHTALGVCPACKMEIVATEADVIDSKKQMVRAQLGDKPPTMKSVGGTGVWNKVHRSCKYGTPVPFDVPIDEYIICILHMNLRFVGAMFEALIVNGLASGGLGERQVAYLEASLSMMGMQFRSSKLQPKPNRLKKMWTGTLKMGGADTRKFMHKANPEAILRNCVFPKWMREPPPGSTASAKRRYAEPARKCEEACTAFKTWRVCWALLNKDVGPTQDDRNKRAEEVEIAGRAFVDAFRAAHKNTQGLYLHMLVAHVPDMIRKYGDLRPFQTQGVEHHHSKRKKIHLHNTNRRKGRNGRLVQMCGQMLAFDVVKYAFDPRFDAEVMYRDHIARRKRSERFLSALSWGALAPVAAA